MNKKNKNAISITGLISSTMLIALAAGGCGAQKINPYTVNLATDPKGATITVWTGFGSNINDIMSELNDQFTADTGINVVYESKGGYDNLRDAVTLGAPTQNYPNVTIGYPDHFVQYVKSDIIVRLDYYFENDANCIGLGDSNNKYPVAINDYYEQYMKENQSIEYKEDGTGYTLGVPFNKSTEFMTYNASFFEYANHIDDSIVVPETWDEVNTIGAKINNIMDNIGSGSKKFVGTDYVLYSDNTHYPTGVKTLLDFSSTDFTKFRPISYDSQSNLFITGLYDWDSSYTTLDATNKNGHGGYISYNEENTKGKTKEFLQELRDLYDAGILGVPATWEETKYASNVFKNLNTVMSIGSTAGASSSTPAGGKFECGAAPVPYKSEDKKFVISQGTNLCLLDKGSEKERVASWVYLKYFSKYCNGEFAADTGYFPACEYAQNGEAYQAFITRTGGSDVEKLKRAVAEVNSNYYNNADEKWTKFVDAPFDGSAFIRNKIDAIPTTVMFSTTDLQKILDDSYATLNEYQNKN